MESKCGMKRMYNTLFFCLSQKQLPPHEVQVDSYKGKNICGLEAATIDHIQYQKVWEVLGESEMGSLSASDSRGKKKGRLGTKNKASSLAVHNHQGMLHLETHEKRQTVKI